MRKSIPHRETIAKELRRRSLLRFAHDSKQGYIAGWVHAQIAAELEAFSQAVTDQQSPRLIIEVPPRHGKLFLASERFPVWHLGHFPDHEIVNAAYSGDLANGFSRAARSLINSEFVKDTFPHLVIAPDQTAVQAWRTTANGGYKATGVGGGLTGFGAHILIIDDPVKNRQEADSLVRRDLIRGWYASTAYTRLYPGGGVLIIMTRWHEDDLAGWVQTEAANGGDQWRVVRFPAIAETDEAHRRIGEALHPDRYDLAKLAQIKAAVGSREWSALYQQRPSPAEGGLIKRNWWKFYRETPALFDEVIQSWDATFKDTQKSDFVVGQVWGRTGAEKYLLDQVRARMDFTATIQAIRTLSAKWPTATAKLIEDKANGPAIITTLKRELQGLIPVNPQGSKEARLSAVAPQIEAGNVYLPDPSTSPWVHDFIEEMAAFPTGAHDDQVDALSQALIRLGGGAQVITLGDILDAHGVENW